jgi:hypothetical protein
LNVVSTPAPVVALGGGKYVMVMPDNTAHRLRLTAFLSTDECATWSQQIPLFSGTAGYSDIVLAGGNILCAYERGHTDTDFNYQGDVGNTIGQIGLVTFNLAALMAGITEQVVYDFNELPAVQNAWAGSASIVDYGTGDHRATSIGSPVYTASPSGIGQSALTFHPGDALLLANQVDPTFDPDYLAFDSGGATLEFGYSIANHGSGVLFGGDSGVGSGTKGITVVVNPNGTVSMTVDDGTHHATITSTIDATNDGAYHRVVCQRDVVSGRLRMWTYRANGAPTEIVASVPDPTSLVAGSLWSGNDPTYLCRYGDTTAGSMTQDITFDLFRYTKKALTADNFTPIPAPAPAPEQLPLPGAATPDTVEPSNLQLWLFDSRGGYSMRTNLGSSPTPTNPPPGYGADYLLDASGHGYYTSFSDTSEWFGSDPTVGSYWTVPGHLASTSLDNSTIGQFDFVSQFSSAWTIAGTFRIPSSSVDAAEILLTNMDGSGQGFSIGTDFAATHRFWFEAQNSHGDFLAEVTVPNGNGLYTADTWYYFALVFDGNGGAGAGGSQGLSAFLIPLTGAPLTLSDVTGNKSSTLARGVIRGDSTAASNSSAAPLKVAGGAGSEMQMADLAIWNTALSDENILALANGRMSKPTATIDGNGSLELAGPDPAFGAANGLINVVNTSTAAGGFVVSGKNEIVASLDGTGNTVVTAGGQLTADHIVQGTLVIGGAAGNPATVTIAASNLSGNPDAVAAAFAQSTPAATMDASMSKDNGAQNQSVGLETPVLLIEPAASGRAMRIAGVPTPTTASASVPVSSPSQFVVESAAADPIHSTANQILKTDDAIPQTATQTSSDLRKAVAVRLAEGSPSSWPLVSASAIDLILAEDEFGDATTDVAMALDVSQRLSELSANTLS